MRIFKRVLTILAILLTIPLIVAIFIPKKYTVSVKQHHTGVLIMKRNEFDSMVHYNETRRVVDAIIYWVAVLSAILIWLSLGA